jgi:type II secretory pathway component PulJ
MYLSVVRASRLRRCGGVTLIEILVAMLIGVGVAATVAWFERAQFLAMEDQAAQLDIQTSARAIVDVFARDVRRAGMDPTCAKNVTAVVDASPTALRFQADLNANGALDAASEDLLYRLVDGIRVERGQGTTVEPLLEDIDLSGSRIRYFDAAGSELLASTSLTAAQRALIRRVRLELAVRVPARSGSGAPDLVARAATDVELRNRFFVGVTGCS